MATDRLMSIEAVWLRVEWVLVGEGSSQSVSNVFSSIQ